jgi:DNA invertase Pin-like site-specific DNA recombinase
MVLPLGYDWRILGQMNAKHNENTNKTAIIWGRFSSDNQSDGDSKDRQQRNNREYANREGIKILAEHFDEATSVKDGATPLFKKVVGELPKGVGIVCENLDRISRGHPWRAKAYLLDLIEAGHSIYTSGDKKEYSMATIEQLDTMMLGDMGANVARYSNNLRKDRVREEKQKAIALARQGTPAPLGSWLPKYLKYNFETKQYTIDETIKQIIKRIFVQYVNGFGTHAIAKELNKDNIPSLGSKELGGWSAASISKILRSERHIGTLTINKERMPNALPPAITEKLYYQVQSLLKVNENRRGNRLGIVRNVFRGLCKCSVCNSSIKVFGDHYMGCTGYKIGKRDKNGNPCTVKTMVPFKELEREFIEWFIPMAKEQLLGTNEKNSEIDAMETKLTSIKKQIEITMDMMLDTTTPLPIEQIKSRLSKLEIEKRYVEANITELKSKESSNNNIPKQFDELKTLLIACNTGNQEARKRVAAIVPSIIKKIVIDITDKRLPSFNVVLINGKEINYTMTMAQHYGVEAYNK